MGDGVLRKACIWAGAGAGVCSVAVLYEAQRTLAPGMTMPWVHTTMLTGFSYMVEPWWMLATFGTLVAAWFGFLLWMGWINLDVAMRLFAKARENEKRSKAQEAAGAL
jgi:hypothetical protein